MIYRFDDFQIDLFAGTLLRRGDPTPIRPKGLALLADLITRRSRWVNRAELAHRLWRDVRVGDSSLSTLLGEVRKAVGDDGTRQVVIKTRPGLGYRFVAPVQLVDARSEGIGPAETSRQRRLAGPLPCMGQPLTAGRAPEFELAACSLERALTSGPTTLWLTGPSGSGREAFVAELAAGAADRGLRVHRSRCVDPQAPPLLVWWQLAGQLAEGLDPQNSVVAWGSIRDELQRLEHEGGASSSLRHRQRRFAVGQRMATALIREASAGPCVFILEDLHLAAAETFWLLGFVMDHMTPAPLWLIFSSQTDDRVGWQSEAERRLHHHHRTQAIALESVDLEACLEHAAFRGLQPPSDSLARNLHTRAGGRPELFIDLLRTAACPAGVHEPLAGR